MSSEYLGRKFSYKSDTYQVWRYTPPISSEGRIKVGARYNAVKLLDPLKNVGTFRYSENGGGLHSLTNVDPDTHFSIPAEKLASVLQDPEAILTDKIKFDKKKPSSKPRKKIRPRASSARGYTIEV